MHDAPKYYDVGIVGGGLGGLSAAIMLAKAGHSIVLFEKETYPFHKVCGEYISLESWDLLISLGLDLDKLNVPLINTLLLTSPDGSELRQKLPLGGFGISRYNIDHQLAEIARKLNVVVFDGTRVNDVSLEDDQFTIIADRMNVRCKVCCGAFGKRSNLDIRWKRKFTQKKPNALNNFISVKYHALLNQPKDTIALHNFYNGYCGVSPLENDKYCICYLTTAHNLKVTGGNIKKLEQDILFKNSFIREAFSKATLLYKEPLTISQISFEEKEQVENHILLIGDSAGMIAPLCGNGMSMALHASRIACKWIARFLNVEIDRKQMEISYKDEWSRMFSGRLRTGRIIQSLFGREWVTNSLVRILRRFPRLVDAIISRTHGKS
jgi:flavin-dependent dehydrogenase